MWAAVVGLLFLAAASTYLRWRIPGGVGGEEVAVASCQANYARAGNARDSAVVDAQRPIVSRGQAMVARTCGELLRAGALAAGGR